MHASDADIAGKITATSGSIAGNLVSSGINASNITSGRLNISDGSGHYLRMGFGEGDNPFVSGLNVGSYGINMNGGGLSRCAGASNTNGDANYTCANNMTVRGGSVYISAGSNGTSHIFFTKADGTYVSVKSILDALGL